MTARRSRRPAAIASAFVAAIPADISGDPSATRVMLAHPPAASRLSIAHSGRFGPSPDPITASTSAAATTSGTWLIAATARSCVAASRRSGSAPQARASASTRSIPSAGEVAPGTTTHGRPRKRSALEAPNPIALGPGHRMAADEGQAGPFRGGPTIRCFVLATSVNSAPGAARSPSAPSASMRSRQSSGGAASTIRSAPAIASSRLPAARIDDARGQGRPRAIAGRATRPRSAPRPGSARARPQCAGDRPADLTHAEECDPHRAIIAARGRRYAR